jgi:hypothetical protein
MISGWNVKVRRACKKIKKDDMDNFDTDFIDLDQLLGMYLDEFRSFRRANA